VILLLFTSTISLGRYASDASYLRFQKSGIVND